MKSTSRILTSLALSVAMLAPYAAHADHDRDQRRDSKKEWENLAILGGAAALLGKATHNKTLTNIGVVGGLYSLYRLDQDRRSRDRDCRARADFYDQEYFYEKGVRYDRVRVRQGREAYYTFERCTHRYHQDNRRDDRWDRDDHDRREWGQSRGRGRDKDRCDD